MSFSSAFRLWCVAGLLAALVAPAFAQDAANDDAAPADDARRDVGELLRLQFPGVEFEKGPKSAPLGHVASIEVPAEYWFVGKSSLKAFNDALQNGTSSNDLGVVLSVSPERGFWFVSFSYNDSGYVKDDEKDKINAEFAANALKEFREGQEQDNAERRSRGWGELTLSGWEPAPFYDPESKNLTWGLVVDQKGSKEPQDSTINYQSRLLGRRGYVSATLVMDREQAAEAIPAYQRLLKGFEYNSGEKYAEFKSGDKIAEYGLTALVGAGALAVAAKTGILGKLLKPLIFGLVVLGGAISSFFGRFFGRGKTQQADG